MSDKIFRVHPSIGIARFGNSPDFYLAPETIAGLQGPVGQNVSGGLPIKKGTEDTVISEADIRDNAGALTRQAARFKIFAYDDPGKKGERYPNSGGDEIRIGSSVGGKSVTDIIWTVHLANKKANCYYIETGIAPERSVVSYYANGGTPGLRNPQEGDDPNNITRVRRLTLDAGPRVVRGTDADPVAFDKATPASFCDAQGEIIPLPSYPKNYPGDIFSKLYEPQGPIDTLGEMETDADGRLIVAGGYGRAVACSKADGEFFELTSFVDNDGWFDDASDGPVDAVIVFDDGSREAVHGAWVVASDPGYAPQTLNVVSLWDDVYDTWVRNLDLRPDIYDKGYNRDFSPDFYEHVYPIFRAAQLQRWNTNLPAFAVDAHDATGGITPDDAPENTIMAGLAFIRNPSIGDAESTFGAPLMPLSLGDSGQSFLSPSLTQYFFLEQWNDGKFTKKNPRPLGGGEKLDKASLMNCLGGRFSPGIDLTFIVRLRDLYITDWRTSGSGPFRIGGKPLDYLSAEATQPFLTEGYVPLHSAEGSVEPGDICKFMAIPWHTDYNSCATHTTSPYTNSTLYWSWPAQRPVVVYRAKDVVDGKLGEQRYSVRGPGTENENPALQGRYQESIDMVVNWSKIGVVIQGTAIEDGAYSFDHFLEVEGLLDVPDVEPWPINDSGDG